MFNIHKKKDFIDQNDMYKDDHVEEEDDILSNLMDRFQFDCIINTRTIELSEGGFPYVKEFRDSDNNLHLTTEYKVKSNIQLRWIAIEELKQRVIPYMLEIKYPNGKIKWLRVCKMDLTAVEEKLTTK